MTDAARGTVVDPLHVVWLTGASCDGCTIAILGDRRGAAFETLAAGSAPGLPRVVFHHPVLAVESGDAFLEGYRAAASGDLDPFVLVVESALAADADAAPGYWQKCGEEDGAPLSQGDWLERLAPRAAAVVAVGDCAVFGGPHSQGPNPTGAHGVARRLGPRYRSAAGLPVVHLPGCAVPQVFLRTFESVARFLLGEAPAPRLDRLGCPSDLYEEFLTDEPAGVPHVLP